MSWILGELAGGCFLKYNTEFVRVIKQIIQEEENGSERNIQLYQLPQEEF